MNQKIRKLIRLPEFDYSSPGMYFVTVCVEGKRCLFGRVKDGEMMLNEAGRMVKEEWQKLPERFPNIEIDEFMVMPNHFHGIIFIPDVGATLVVARNAETRAATRAAPTLSEIVGAFKSITTNHYIRLVKQKLAPPFPQKLWQRTFHDHIIRNEKSLDETRKYIAENPPSWEKDELFAIN